METGWSLSDGIPLAGAAPDATVLPFTSTRYARASASEAANVSASRTSAISFSPAAVKVSSVTGIAAPALLSTPEARPVSAFFFIEAPSVL